MFFYKLTDINKNKKIFKEQVFKRFDLYTLIYLSLPDMCTQNTQAFGFEFWIYTQYSNPNPNTQKV